MNEDIHVMGHSGLSIEHFSMKIPWDVSEARDAKQSHNSSSRRQRFHGEIIFGICTKKLEN